MVRAVTGRVVGELTVEALAQVAHYYSTACLHQLHDQCRLTCKTCGDPCRCACHLKETGDQG
jgi:hypothetical protein